MATDGFRRRTRTSVDAAVHHIYCSLAQRPRAVFTRLLAVARTRSDLMRHAPDRDGVVLQVTALANLARFEHAFVRAPETWRGAHGHPLAVVDSLATHLVGRYPTPRFLSSVWFGDDDARRRWVIAHASGEAFRRLTLPVAFTRQMEHHFLRTPDHVPFDIALRRAEILGLGGTPELADALLATPLAEHFEHGEAWRKALAWLARCGDSVVLADIRPLVDFLTAHIRTISLRGRTFASVMRLAREWHASLARQRAVFLCWPASRWRGLIVRVSPTPSEPRASEWTVVELLDSHALAHEGRLMRHCVATYARRCRSELSRIWSLRHRWAGEAAPRPVLTIEVYPRIATIVQVRGPANSRPHGEPLSLLHRWAAREGLHVARYA